MYSALEVFRTAFKYVEPKENTQLPHGINQVCICCKAGSTSGMVSKIIDPVELRPWSDFYTSGQNEWSAYECHSCGYKWSWYKKLQ